MQRQFRPELLNRLDRVVVFRPLERSVMRRLLEHELASVLGRRGFRVQPWAVEWDDAAVDFLLEKGFTADLGARPLKRAVERYLLAPLATAIVEREVPEGDQFLFITAAGDRLRVSFVDPDAGETTPPAGPSVASIASLVVDPRVGRPSWRRWRRSGSGLLPLVESWVRGRPTRSRPPASRGSGSAGTAPRRWRSWSTSIVWRPRGEPASVWPSGSGAGTVARRQTECDCSLNGCTCSNARWRAWSSGGPPTRSCGSPRPAERATKTPRARSRSRWALMYERWAAARGMRFERVEGADASLTAAVVGLAAFTILAGETGLHVFETPEGDRASGRASVRVTVAPWSFGHPAGGDLRDAAERALAAVSAEQTVVRRYRREPSPLVRDAARGWRTGRLDRVLAGDFDVME